MRLGPRSSHRPSVMPFCCLPTFSIIGLNFSLVPLLLGNIVEKRVRVMRYEVEARLFFHLAAELEWLDSPRYCLNQYLLPCFSVYFRPSGLTISGSPLSARYFRKARICRHARIHLQHTEYLAANILLTRLLYINASKPSEPLH